MSFLKKIAKLIGPLLLVLILVNFIQWEDLVRIFSNASIHYIALACIFAVLMFLGKIYRIFLLLKKSRINVKFLYLMKIYAYSFFIGSMSNIFISDVANAGFLMLDQKNKVRISNIFILSRLFDTFFVAAIFFVCLSLNYDVIDNYLAVQSEKIPLFVFLGICLFLIPFVFFKSKFAPFMRDFTIMAKEMLPQVFFCTVFIYFCWIMAAIFDLKALSIDIPVSFLLMSYASGMVISILPISIAGIGTRDMLLIFIMGLLHVSPEGAIALSTTGFLFRPFIAVLILYLVSAISLQLREK